MGLPGQLIWEITYAENDSSRGDRTVRCYVSSRLRADPFRRRTGPVNRGGLEYPDGLAD